MPVDCGWATANAKAEVKAEADYVTEVPGGRGAVREVVELLLKAQGRWEDILRHYEQGLGDDDRAAGVEGLPGPQELPHHAFFFTRVLVQVEEGLAHQTGPR